MIVARQSGDLGEAEPLVEAAVPLGGWAAQVAAGRAQGGGAVAERLDQVAADAFIPAVFDDQQVVEAGDAGDYLAQHRADDLVPGAGLDHHWSAGPVTVLTEDGPIGRGPFARQEAAHLLGLLLGEPIADLAEGSSGQLRTSLGGTDRPPEAAGKLHYDRATPGGRDSARNAKGARWTSV